jgi:hypothetical protein
VKNGRTHALFETKSKDDLAAEKLIFDTKSGRFYESRIAEICEEEFCLIDTDNGKPIMLTREEKERIFLDSIQSYYFKGQNGLSDIQFDKLRSVSKFFVFYFKLFLYLNL